jgi:hypothetical protein
MGADFILSLFPIVTHFGTRLPVNLLLLIVDGCYASIFDSGWLADYDNLPLPETTYPRT